MSDHSAGPNGSAGPSLVGRCSLSDVIGEYLVAAGACLQGTALLEAAMFIEDVFGLRIVDDEITVTNLGSRQAIERFVEAKLCRVMDRCVASAE